MSNVRYFHFRNHRPQDQTIDNRGGVTVAYRQEGNGVRMAIQGCFYKDNFCKATGRLKATGKLNSKSSTFIPNVDVYDFHTKLVRVPNSSTVLVDAQ